MFDLILRPVRFVTGVVDHVLALLLFRERDLHFLLCSCDAFNELPE